MSTPAVAPAAPRRVLAAWEWRVVWLLVLCFATWNLPWRLDDLDQAKQANVSLEMVNANHWWFQHTPGNKAIATKPPLVGWMSVGVYLLPFSNWDLAWRLPSFVAALALAYLMWRAGEALWPGRGGIVAMAAFGFNLISPRLATLVRTDMPLTFFITGVGLIVWHHARDGGQRPWTNVSRRAVFWLLLAGMMTKGPIAYAFLLPGMLAHSWVTRRRGGAAASLWGGWWHWTLPLVPFLAWVCWGMASVPGFYTQVVGKEFVGRFTVGAHAVHKSQPLWFYFFQLLKQWLPWDVLLVAALARMFMGRGTFAEQRRTQGFAAAFKGRSRQMWEALCREPGTLWLVCWALGGFVFMSLVPSKRPDRIFPVVPPLALLLTALLARASWPERIFPTAISSSVPPMPPPMPGVPPPLPPAAMAPASTMNWPWDWAQRTTFVAVAVGLGSIVYSVSKTYLQHDHARASFAAHIRRMEAGKTVGLVASNKPPETDETMLVYLRQLEFLTPAEATERWRTGKLDALVVNEDARAEFGNLLAPFVPAQPVLETVGSKPAYFLLVSHPPDDKHKAPAKPHNTPRNGR